MELSKIILDELMLLLADESPRLVDCLIDFARTPGPIYIEIYRYGIIIRESAIVLHFLDDMTFFSRYSTEIERWPLQTTELLDIAAAILQRIRGWRVIVERNTKSAKNWTIN